MLVINPYLSFNTNCREAMNFYKDALGGEVIMQTVGESAVKDSMPKEMANNVMHATLTKDGAVLLMASDKMDPSPYMVGNNNWISLQCDTLDEINNCFAKLSVGGTVMMPLAVQFWGAMFGMLTDKFGMNWMLNQEMK